ncbi:MAG: HD domain-containing protein [Desulfuromonadales bacterium]|nr:HD domain-containing protein [Desulfuromonadales bacterium]
MGIEIALYHHERFDGKGYPDGLVGRNIPLSARIMAVADVYDALRSDRCYRKGFDHEQARNMILEHSGTHFDPVIVEAFLELEDEFRKIMETYI